MQNGAPLEGIPLPHEKLLTPEAQAQLMAQQQEALHAQIGQLEAMIQSMEQNDLPREQIQHFRDMKRALEEQQVVEPQPEDANPPERTEEELNSELAESLQQTGMPIAERKQMLETLSAEPEPTPEPPNPPPTHPR